MLYRPFLLVPSVLSKINANFSRAFLVLSPSSGLGIVCAGGFTRVIMMPSSDFVIKSPNYAALKLVCYGKNTTLSEFTSALVL